MAAKKNNLSKYTVRINGIDHVLKLSPEDAERYGRAARKVEPREKSRQPVNNKAVTNTNNKAAADGGVR